MRALTACAALLLLLSAEAAGLSLLEHGAGAHVAASATLPGTPDDPGWTGTREGWAQIQWNLLAASGVDAPGAWANLGAAGAPGAAGVTVAVLDTGIAYPSDDPARPGSPDLDPAQFVPGYDFVDDDPVPYDVNGHGTHVASIIAEQTDNGYGLAGLAYGVHLMPVRVLDRTGYGDSATIARGVRFAVEHGARVVNLSLNFPVGAPPAAVSALAGALEEAHDRGVVVVVGSGNASADAIAYPASAPYVIAVGATTDSACLASYSNHGPGMDLVAPGGGSDAYVAHDPHCRVGRRGDPVYQVTRLDPRTPVFGIAGYTGTSMAAPHVSAAAAMVIASRVIGSDPDPGAVARRLEQSARDLGPPGYDSVYGWGLVDVATATTPGPPHRPDPGPPPPATP
jgi:serine protease